MIKSIELIVKPLLNVTLDELLNNINKNENYEVIEVNYNENYIKLHQTTGE